MFLVLQSPLMTFSELSIGMLPLVAPGLGSGLLVVALDIACNQMVEATFQHPDQQTNLCVKLCPLCPSAILDTFGLPVGFHLDVLQPCVHTAVVVASLDSQGPVFTTQRSLTSVQATV